MVLGFSEDFSSKVALDSQLKGVPTSGLYVNSGVHPSINTENLLDFLPKTDLSFVNWSATKDYGEFLESRDREDVVNRDSRIYQSIQGSNIGQDPLTETEYWVETNVESLRLKIFLEQVKDKVYADLALTKRLINNQYLYEDGDIAKTLDNDYAAWVLEPKGSDYVSIRVNEISLQKDGTTPVNVYVINQNELIETITLAPDNGRLAFRNTDITFSGKGSFKIVIDSTDVYVGGATVDPLKFDGFVAYTANGTGDAPDTADYTYNTFGNGLGINVTAFLDATNYIEENLSELGSYIRATFEYMVFQMFLHNANYRSNRSQRIQMDDQLLMGELKNTQLDTVVSRYQKEKKRAITAMRKTFDTQLNDHEGIQIKVGSV
jgi:hypothetical protein